uniref:Uncharacterized protein n=1 Tax=Romanomermis culicivorax TaxID=13658 RepID=A0A915JY16_ROMCU
MKPIYEDITSDEDDIQMEILDDITSDKEELVVDEDLENITLEKKEEGDLDNETLNCKDNWHQNQKVIDHNQDRINETAFYKKRTVVVISVPNQEMAEYRGILLKTNYKMLKITVLLLTNTISCWSPMQGQVASNRSDI